METYEPDDEFEAPRRRWSALFTPIRVVLALVWVGAAVTAAYGIVIAKSLPMSVSGFFVWGVAFLLFAIISVAASLRAGRRGEGRLAFFAALFGGLCFLGACGALTTTIVLGLLASPS